MPKFTNPDTIENRNDYTTTTYSPTDDKKPGKNGHAVPQPRPTGQIRLAEHTPVIWQLSDGLFSLLHPGVWPSHVERSSTGSQEMTIQVKVSVQSGSRGSETTLRQLISEIERIKRYDGTVVRVTVEYPRIAMITRPQPLHEIIESMLAEADSVVSPHYRAPPRGLPYALRVQAAMRVFKDASPEFRREAERRSLGVPPRNRQEFMLQNPGIFEHFYPTRHGPLETEFLRALRLR